MAGRTGPSWRLDIARTDAGVYTAGNKATASARGTTNVYSCNVSKIA
jgi:hypothetical protein